MLSCLTFSLVIIIAVCESLNQLKAPISSVSDPMTQTKAQTWHNQELCTTLSRLFKGKGDAQHLEFNDYFPNKVMPLEDFDFVEDKEKMNGLAFEKVVTNLQDITNAVSDYVTLDVSNCEFLPSLYSADQTEYSITSKQTISFNLKGVGKSDVSVQHVTYVFDASNDKLKAVKMTTISDDGYPVAKAIAVLKDQRRRLMQQEPVKLLMKMPKEMSIPLVIAMVAIFIFFSAMLISKAVCCCCGSLGIIQRKTEKICDEEVTII